MTKINQKDINKIVNKLSFVTILGNVLLSALKLFAGIFGKSSAMISDAVHSLSDVVTTFIALIGVKISNKKEDKNHQYGHEQFESLASLFLGILLFITGFGIGYSGLKTIFAGNYENIEVPGMIALIAALVSIITKEAMYWYTKYYATKINSSAFMADAWHHRSDAFSSIGSLIGIAGAKLGYPVLDPIASLVICMFIFKVSIDIFKDAINKLTDTADITLEDEISSYVSKNKEVRNVDLIRTRKFGSKVYVDLEISVDGDYTLSKAHGIAENIHNGIERKMKEVKHVMIHVNPYKE